MTLIIKIVGDSRKYHFSPLSCGIFIYFFQFNRFIIYCNDINVSGITIFFRKFRCIALIHPILGCIVVKSNSFTSHFFLKCGIFLFFILLFANNVVCQ